MAVFMASFMAPAAKAQVTPSELSRLSLEDLLGVEIEDIVKKKRWFIAYELKYLDIGQYQQGTNRLTFDEVQFVPGETRTDRNYPIVPTFIRQTVHAFSLGRAFSSEFSVGINIPYVMQSTQHVSIVPEFNEFTLRSGSIGDISIMGQYHLTRSATSHTTIGFGISLPTGSINQTGDTPRAGTGTLERLPYTMQIGAGTYDLLANLSYERDAGKWALGIDASTTIRTGRNANAYRLGNNYGVALNARFKGWSAIRPSISLSFRATKRIQGRDESLVIQGSPFPFGASITDPDNFGGEKIKVGGNVRVCLIKVCSLSLNFKGAVPFYQNLNGIQPRERFSLSSAINYSF
ncbi:MAG: hypothetical protein COB37_10365 [Kordiimonadales bacterium]|nr:MAG: hypothetical protein COB37_10365 [Kordiimonadales bacterium]